MTDMQALLTPPKTIAMVGASSNDARPSHSIMAMLMQEGFRVIPINPNEDYVLGEKAYASLETLPDDLRRSIDIVNVFRRPAQTPQIAEQAVKIGAKCLWLQLGITNEDAQEIAQKAGIDYIEDTCIAVEYRLKKAR